MTYRKPATPGELTWRVTSHEPGSKASNERPPFAYSRRAERNRVAHCHTPPCCTKPQARGTRYDPQLLPRAVGAISESHGGYYSV